MNIAQRRAALMERVRVYGGPLNEPAVLAQFMAQVMHESGGLRYVREVWGPTAAQKRYEGRADLGNVKPGDGKRFMGRDVLQITGRANYRALTAWVRREFGSKVDFEATPEALEGPEWLGIGAIWYFLAARPKLIRYCRDGNIEMVTRLVNGGLNGYADRLRWYDDAALKLLGFPTIKAFQNAAGLSADGISGPKTRAAMHHALTAMSAPVTRPAPHVNETPKHEHDRPNVVQPEAVKIDAKDDSAAMLGKVILAALALWAATAAAWFTDLFEAVRDFLIFWQ